MGQGPKPAPVWVGNIIAQLLQWIGPRGLEFGRYSIEYHYIRNWLYAVRHMGRERAERHTPAFARKIIADYNSAGAISDRWEAVQPCMSLWTPDWSPSWPWRADVVQACMHGGMQICRMPCKGCNMACARSLFPKSSICSVFTAPNRQHCITWDPGCFCTKTAKPS